MILSGAVISQKIENKELKIVPRPATDWDVTFEGHIADVFYRVKSRGEHGSRIAIDLSSYKAQDFAEEFWESIYPTPEGHIAIHPMELILCYTKEKFSIPKSSKICCFVEGKSGLARIGLGVHITAPIIHPGFGDGKDFGAPIMLEMFNHSQNIILLKPGLNVCQYMFMSIDGDMTNTQTTGFGSNQPKSS